MGKLKSLPIASIGRAERKDDRLSPGHAPFPVYRGWWGGISLDDLAIRIFHGPGNPNEELGEFLREADVKSPALRLDVNELPQQDGVPQDGLPGRRVDQAAVLP